MLSCNRTSTCFIASFFCRSALIGFFCLASSCSSTNVSKDRESFQYSTSTENRGVEDPSIIEKLIREEYLQWKGVPHRLGGTGRDGVDCSGFVLAVYKNVFNIVLPRTTKDQVMEGNFVKRRELMAGDLVFFRQPDSQPHVGIFLSSNEFVHASKTKGIIISEMNRHYWGKYYWTARRILPN